MNRLHDAMLTLCAAEMEAATSNLLAAARKWERAWSRATGCESRFFAAVRLWGGVCWEAKHVAFLMDDWRVLDIILGHLDGRRLATWRADLALLACELVDLASRGAAKDEYGWLCDRLRAAVRKRVD